MSSTNRGPGRPSKPDPETLQRRRDFLLLHENKVRVEDIAQQYKLAPSRVWDIIREARADVAAVQALNQPPPDPAAESQPAQPPRRLSRRTAQSRAWDIADRRPNFALGLGANSLWVRTVVAIHEEGDGFRLHIGEQGARFRSRDDLAVLLLGHLDRQDVDVNGWLTALFERGRLIDIDSVDVGIPRGLGLIPGENSRGEPLKVAPVKPARSAQAPLPFKPMVVTGGLSDSEKIDPPDSGNIRIFQESDSGNIRIFQESDSGNIAPDDSGNIRISPESEVCAATSTAAAAAKENQSLNSSSSSTGSHAGDSREIDNIPGVDSDKITADDSYKLSQRSPLAILTDELATLAKLERVPTDQDREIVKGWMDDGYSGIAMRDNIAFKLKVRGDKPPTALRYFDKRLREKYKPGHERTLAGMVPSVEPPAALSKPEIEEPILGSEPLDQWARVDRAVRDAIGKPVHNAWMRGACFGGIDGGEVTIKFAHGFTRDHVRKNFELHLLRAWQVENPGIRRVEMVVEAVRRDGGG